LKKQLKQLNFEIKVLDQANQIIQMIGSTECNDRVGDKMVLAGGDFTNYLKNPVILANHNYGDSEKSTVIGKALDVNIVGSQLIFKIQFADTPNGNEWFYLYANKFMNASSIGFIPKEYTPNDSGGEDFTSWELLELSMVAVPCNPEAVQNAYKAGKISKSMIEKINESEVENMKVEELNILVSKTVDEKMKTLNASHVTEIAAKVKEIGELKDQIKGLKESTLIKTGAALSAATCSTLKKAIDGISGHVATLKSLVDPVNTQDVDGDPDDGDTKDYTDEEIQKMVSDNVNKKIEEATK
jgi:hypothetical protein